MKRIQNKNAVCKQLLGAALVLGMTSTAAMAQTSVTVFGHISLGLTKATGGSTQLATTGWGNGVGFKGTEDLGGGLSAFFHIENRFASDTGVAATPFWAEKTAVGLRGGFGTVQLGRFGNAYDDILGLADPFGETVANMPHEAALGEGKWDNSVGYYSPVMGGFSTAFTTATTEDKDRTPYALNVKYANGPAVVALGYVSNGLNKVRSVSIAGNYDFGAAKVFGGVTNSTNTGAGDARNMQLGVALPVGAAGSIKAAVSSFKPDTDLSDRNRKYAVGYWHSLSKRTMLYADVSRSNLKVANATSNVNAFDIGILHRF